MSTLDAAPHLVLLKLDLREPRNLLTAKKILENLNLKNSIDSVLTLTFSGFKTAKLPTTKESHAVYFELKKDKPFKIIQRVA